MLTDKLRDGAHGKVFKILFWIIILSFIFAGVGNYLIPKLDTDPVTIGNFKISSNSWNEQVNNRTRSIQQAYGANAGRLMENPEYVRALRMQVLESMIDSISLNSVAYDQGIKIGDEEVKDAIRQDRTFFKDGRFNNDQFLALVRNMGSSPDYYAEQLRTRLMSSAIADPVISISAVVLPFESNAMAKIIAQTRTVDLYSVDPQSFASQVSVDDDKAKAFYDQHNNLFMHPANVKFSYLLLKKDDLKKELKYTDDDVEQYFDLNQNDFAVPEKRTASQILFKNDGGDVEKRASQALAELKSGKPFEEVAAKYSDDPSFKENKGSLGDVTRGSLSEKLDEALFSLGKAGDFSDVVYDDYGAHIIYLEGITASHVPAFADVKNEAKAHYEDAKALDLYNEKASLLTDISYENPDSLDAAAKATGLKIMQSGEVDLGDSKAPWPFNLPELQKVAFNEENRSSGTNTQVISLGDDACAVLNVSEYHEESLKTFDEVKDEASKLYLADKLNALADQALNDLAADLAKSSTDKPADNISLRENVLITRTGSAVDPLLMQEIFALENKVGSSVVGVNRGLPVLAVLKKVELDKSSDLATYDKILRSQLVQYKADKALNTLYKGARELSDIKYNQDAINLVNQQNDSTD